MSEKPTAAARDLWRRVPNSGPLATVDQWSKWLKKRSLSVSTRFGCTIISLGPMKFPQHISSGADHGDSGNQSPDFTKR